MIKLDRVMLRYNDKEIFSNVSFSINKVGIYLVRGENGVGKSSLLNIIAGLIKVKGEVYNEYIKSMSYVFQNSYLISYLTIKEHLEMFSINPKVLKKFKLMDKLDMYPCSLSSGERQRIALLIALFSDSNLVLLDEPTSNLDPKNQNKFIKEILNAGEKKIVIIVSHDYKDFIDKVDGIIEIKDCKVSFKNISDNEICLNNSNNKKRLNFKEEKKFYFKDSFKVYLVYFICTLLIFIITFVRGIVTNLVKSDINYSVDYNKFYLQKCENIIEGSLNVSLCKNPSDEELNKSEITYYFNYDYLLASLFRNENLKVMNNPFLLLYKGNYPSKSNEVIANENYKIGDFIDLEANLLVNDNKIDIYHKTIKVEVVGIYKDLNFYNDNSIYFDYDLLEQFFNEEILINHQLSLAQYYKNLEIDNYRYLSFDYNEKFAKGEKYEYYKSINQLITQVDFVLDKIKILIAIFSLYLVIRMNKLRLVSKQKDLSFMIANSFSKNDLVRSDLIRDGLILFSITSFFVLILVLFKSSNLVPFFLFLLASFILLFLEESIFFSRKRIASLMREEIW